jgi:hypothetical protein
LGILTLRARATIALGAYMGLWLLPFGALVYRSRFIPRVLGILLLVAGYAYVVSTLTFFLVPGFFHVAYQLMTVLAAAGEGSIVCWLLLKGARAEGQASEDR